MSVRTYSYCSKMAIPNLTEDENQKSYCSAELSAGIQSQLIFLSVMNILLSMSAFLENTLILVALQKETSLHMSSKLLYRNLATTDLCVGIIAEPLSVTYWLSVVNERWHICRYAYVAHRITAYILCAVSLATITAISLDRLLALLLGLRYRHVVTSKRIYLTVTCFWIMSIVGTITCNFFPESCLWCRYIVISTCLITSIFCYTKICLTLRHYQIHVQDHVHQEQPRQTTPLNIARYKQAMSSALWVQLTLLACYLPHGILGALVVHRGPSSSVYLGKSLTLTLVYINSSLNPILYCWKIKEVRQAVRCTIRQLSCSSN